LFFYDKLHHILIITLSQHNAGRLWFWSVQLDACQGFSSTWFTCIVKLTVSSVIFVSINWLHVVLIFTTLTWLLYYWTLKLWRKPVTVIYMWYPYAIWQNTGKEITLLQYFFWRNGSIYFYFVQLVEIPECRKIGMPLYTKMPMIGMEICAPPGRIMFNHMAPMAETPHTQNRNGSKVSHKVCSKWLSLHKQCHKHAQRVKVVYSRATQKSSQSHNATQNT